MLLLYVYHSTNIENIELCVSLHHEAVRNSRTDILFYLSLHKQPVDLIGAQCSVAEGMQHFKLGIGWIVFSLAFLCYFFFSTLSSMYCNSLSVAGTEVPMHISLLCLCFYTFLQPRWPCPVVFRDIDPKHPSCSSSKASFTRSTSPTLAGVAQWI